MHVHVSVIYSCRWLAYALVCVNVALTVRAGVRHILEVIDQTGDQAAAKITPGNESKGEGFRATSSSMRLYVCITSGASVLRLRHANHIQ